MKTFPSGQVVLAVLFALLPQISLLDPVDWLTLASLTIETDES
jgi:hypothetical protein